MLLAGWLASAAGVVRSHPPRMPRPSAESMQLDALVVNVQSQAARLRERLAAAPAPHPSTRNPFTFAEPPREPVPRAAVRAPAIVAAEAVPELDLVLIGIAEDGATRTAIIQSGDELLMVTEGQTLRGRYRVGKVGADALELVEVETGAIRRLYLKSPVSPL